MAAPVAMETLPVRRSGVCASKKCVRAQRSLFGGRNSALGGAANDIEAENDYSEVDADELDSESEFEPSDAAGSDQSDDSEEDCVSLCSVRKRKRVASLDERKPSLRLACCQCGVELSSPARLADHEREPHPFLCDIEGCGRSFADEAVAIRHVEVWHQVRDHERLVCQVCDELFLTLHDLMVHRRAADHGLDDCTSGKLSPLKLFVCDVVATCRQKYKKKDKLVQHKKRHHEPSEDGSVFECDRCEADFLTRHERALHTQAKHPGHTSKVQTPSFACEFVVCNKSYSKREHLKRHVLATHDAPQEKPFGCDLCGVRFGYKHALSRHHTNCHTADAERPYSCSVCLLAFKKKSLLQAHSFVHTGVLPFECEDCGERFLKRFQLARHERKHANARPSQAQVFMCEHDDCGELLFSFQEKSDHMKDAHGVVVEDEPSETQSRKGKNGKRRKLSGVWRELRCLVCNQVFARIQNLRSHLRTHFEDLDERKLHVCPMDGCDKAYTKKSNLMAHYNAAHDPVKSQRFKCPYEGCGGGFGYKKVLQTHIAAIHERQNIKAEDGVGSDSPSKLKTPTRRGRKAVGLMERTLGSDLSVKPDISEITLRDLS